MNKDNAHLYLPFVIAISEGKILQSRLAVEKNRWSNVSEPTFNGDFEYRIKPTPMEFYAMANDDKTDIFSGIFKTKQDAEYYKKSYVSDNYNTIVHLREVE